MLSRGWAHRATRGAAWLALLLSLALTFAAWRFADARERQVARAELQGAATRLAAQLSARMLAYEQLLRGGAGLFGTTGPVGRSDWQAFVRTIGLDALPGIEGMGWAQRVSAAELDAHVAAIRSQGVPDYRVFPSTGGETYGPVVYLEPYSGRNLRAIGYDMHSEPVRRRAMQTARDTGHPSLTGRVVLVQEGRQPRQTGFLAYLPVYRRGAPTDTVEARRDALLGWVYAPFRAADFVHGALGGAWLDLSLEIRDARDGALMYTTGDTDGERDRRHDALRLPVKVVDREWELSVWPTTETGPAAPRGSIVAAIGGTVGSLLIFAIVWTLATTRSRALAIADRMTVALRQSNETLELRVRDRTASLRDSNRRLASVNDRLRAVNAAFGMIGAPGPVGERLDAIVAQLRAIVPADIAVAVAFRAAAVGAPAIGLDAAASMSEAERDRWREDALASDRSDDPPPAAAGGTQRLLVPLLDAQGHARGYLTLGRRNGGFTAEDSTVLSQFALLLGTSLSLHETLASERNARAEAERADRAKEEMLAIVSHELRTPLNAIQGWLHVLRRRRADDAQLLDRAIEVIQRNLDTQVQLVDDLLDTARIVSGKLRLELRPLDLAELLRTAVDAVRPLADARKLELTLSVSDGPFDTVGDPSRLEQVVWNLLTNAVKFTPAGGRVAVRLERLGWLAQLDVEDNGQGIEPAFLPHVFDRFRQADSSSTRTAGGLGLGLALVQHIVQAHGGQAMVRSDGPGRGACFTVSLPLGAAGLPDWRPATPLDAPFPAPDDDTWPAVADPMYGHAAAAQVLEGPDRLAGLSVLVVEDHDDSRDLLAELLASQGAQVLQAASAQQAMATLSGLGSDALPSVLLCDIALPGESGYGLLARIRRLEDEAGRPADERMAAFALSAFTRAEDRQRSLEAGFREHLGKPLSQADLVARLERLRDRIRHTPPPHAH